MEPLIARLLREHGVDPTNVPKGFTLQQFTRDGRDGIVVDTIVPDPGGDPYGLLDAYDEPVTYRKFYPEPAGTTVNVQSDISARVFAKRAADAVRYRGGAHR